jgi:LytR cell envelope-related transcriptional attenuator
MQPGVRSAVTLAVLAVVLLVAAAWGFQAATEPFPGKVDVPTCVNQDIRRGDKVYPDQVVVSVFNAGSREGLAGRTMGLLADKGFRRGDSGNAPKKTKVRVAEIWTDEPKGPAVRLVASRLGPAVHVVRRDTNGAGVVIVVGDGFKALRPGRKFVVADHDSVICTPPVS